MPNTNWMPDVYRAPEVVEVGDAEELTLGGCNCAADDCATCKKSC